MSCLRPALVRGTGLIKRKSSSRAVLPSIPITLSNCCLCQHHALPKVRSTLCFLYHWLDQNSDVRKIHYASPSSPEPVNAQKELAIGSYTNGCMSYYHQDHVEKRSDNYTSTIGSDALDVPGDCKFQRHTQHHTLRPQDVPYTNDAQPLINLPTAA